jgi:hypothetical protein
VVSPIRYACCRMIAAIAPSVVVVVVCCFNCMLRHVCGCFLVLLFQRRERECVCVCVCSSLLLPVSLSPFVCFVYIPTYLHTHIHKIHTHPQNTHTHTYIHLSWQTWYLFNDLILGVRERRKSKKKVRLASSAPYTLYAYVPMGHCLVRPLPSSVISNGFELSHVGHAKFALQCASVRERDLWVQEVG